MKLPFRYAALFKLNFTHGIFLKLLCFLCLNYSFAQAQDRDSVKVNVLREVKIRGLKNIVRNESATPAQVLSGAELQRLNSFSVADALRYFSGIQLKDYGGVGGLKTVNVRGMGSNHTAVFYDGVQMGNAQNGQVDLGRFSLDNMEEVALYNGQNANLFQPARSFASTSTIYLKTTRPKFEEGKSFNFRAAAKAGSFGLINPSLLYEQKIALNTALSVSTEYVRSIGDYKFRYTNGVYDTTARRNNSDIDAYRLEAGLSGTLKDSASWSIKAYGYTSERGLPGAIVSNRFDYSQRQWDRNFFAQGHFETRESKRYALMINAKYANDYLRYLDPEYITLDGFLENKFRQQELYLSAANRFKISQNWGVALSTDYQTNTLNANLYRFPYPTRHTVLTALASEIRFADFSVQGSILSTLVFDRVKEFTSAGDKQEWSPTFMATYHPFGNKDLMLRAFYKNIFRMPTFNDLYYTFIGNTLLRPEFTDQYDLGITYTLQTQHAALASLSIQADAYYNRVKDKIVAVPSLNLYRWTMYNIGEVAVKGLEVNMQSLWEISNDLSLRAALSYTFQQSRPIIDGIKSNYNIPYIPLHSGSFTLSADWKKLEFNYSYIYSGERYNQISTDQNAVYNQMEPWYTHDLGMGYLFSIAQKKAKVNFEVNNLFNQDREMIVNFPMPRRFYRLRLSYTI